MGGCTSSGHLVGDQLPLELSVDEGEAWMAGNQLLNLWRHAEVLSLQRRYRQARKAAGAASSSSSSAQTIGLPYDKVEQLFVNMPEGGLAKGRIGMLFDARQAGNVDFRDLCRGLSLCCKGTRRQKIRWLFDLFSSSQYVYFGLRPLQPPAEVVALLRSDSDDHGAQIRRMRQEDADDDEDGDDLQHFMRRARLQFLLADIGEAEGKALADFVRKVAPAHAVESLDATGWTAALQDAFDSRKQPKSAPASPRSSTARQASEENGSGANGGVEDARISWQDFQDWGSRYLPAEIVDEVLDKIFWLLPSKEDERREILRLLKDHNIQDGDSLYVIQEEWWLQWCAYVAIDAAKLEQVYSCSNPLESSADLSWDSVVLKPSSQRGRARPRPRELDNSILSCSSDGSSWALRPHLQVVCPAPSAEQDSSHALERVVAVTKGVWELLLGFYGGGPAFPRRVVRKQTRRGSFLAVDLYPKLMRVAILDGRLGTNGYTALSNGDASSAAENGSSSRQERPGDGDDQSSNGRPRNGSTGNGASSAADSRNGASRSASSNQADDKGRKEVLAVEDHRLCYVSHFDTADSFIRSIEEFILPDTSKAKADGDKNGDAAGKKKKRTLKQSWGRSFSRGILDTEEPPEEASTSAKSSRGRSRPGSGNVTSTAEEAASNGTTSTAPQGGKSSTREARASSGGVAPAKPKLRLWVAAHALLSKSQLEKGRRSTPHGLRGSRSRSLSGSDMDLENEERAQGDREAHGDLPSEPVFVMGNQPSSRGARAPHVCQWKLYDDALRDRGLDPQRACIQDLHLRDKIDYVLLMVEVIPPVDAVATTKSVVRWPRDAFDEGPTFRFFKIGDQVDAMDYRGSWYPATVASVAALDARSGVLSDSEHPLDNVTLADLISSRKVEQVPYDAGKEAVTAPTWFPRRSSSSEKKGRDGADETVYVVRLHYDAFPENWDEWFLPGSPRIAPRNSAALVRNRSGTTRSLHFEYSATGRSFVGEPEANARPNGSARILTRSSTPGRPFAPGACGLLNLCNTCYINAGLQCLSFTPLLRAYLLSGRYTADINRNNPLGTGGRVVEEFASVIRDLWSQKYVCVNPSKFKRVLGKFKSQFAGQEQEDSQEFMSVVLDSLHEDCNRILDKPYVPDMDDIVDNDGLQHEASNGDHHPAEATALATPNRSSRLRMLGKEAWRRHLARNQSTVVDLFQGQLKTRIKCKRCRRAILKFEPFMFMSLPIPRNSEKAFFTMVFLDPSVGRVNLALEKSPRGRKGSQAPYPWAVKVGVVVPKDATVDVLRRAVAKQLDMDPNTLCVAEVSHLQIVKTHYASDGDEAVPIVSLGGSQIQVPLVGGMRTRKQKNRSVDFGGDDAGRLFDGTDRVLFQVPQPAYDPEFFREDDNGGAVVYDPDLPRKSVPSAFPSKWEDVAPGLRCDVRDYRGHWTAAYIVREVQCFRDAEDEFGRLKEATESVEAKAPLEKGFLVHFDQFADKWDEIVGASEWKNGVVAPLHKHTPPLMGVFEVVATHRRYRRLRARRHNDTPGQPAESKRQPAGGTYVRRRTPVFDGGEASPIHNEESELYMEPFGFPMLFHVPPETTVGELAVQLYDRILPFVRQETASATAALEDDSTVGSDPRNGHDEGVNGLSLPLHRRSRSSLPPIKSWPFRVTVIDRLDPDACSRTCSGSRSSGASSGCRGCLIHDDPLLWNRPVNNFIMHGWAIGIDWLRDEDYEGVEWGPLYHESVQRAEEFVKKSNEGVTLSECLDEYTKQEELTEQDAVYCSQCKQHTNAVVQTSIWRLPEILILQLKRFQTSITWREKLNALVTFPLNGLDMSEYMAEAAYDPLEAESRTEERQSEELMATIDRGEAVYDLFAVANHLGSLHRGHYTAFAKASQCTPDGIESLTSALDGRWLSFDDEYVNETPAEKVVNPAAYVLFYRKRHLSPSNMINLTV